VHGCNQPSATRPTNNRSGSPSTPTTRSRHDPADSGKYFVSTEMATVVASLARRPPEPHPGKLAKPVMIPIQLKRSPAGLFPQPAVSNGTPSRPRVPEFPGGNVQTQIARFGHVRPRGG